MIKRKVDLVLARLSDQFEKIGPVTVYLFNNDITVYARILIMKPAFMGFQWGAQNLPRRLLIYLICHELAHFYSGIHGKTFYRYLKKFLWLLKDVIGDEIRPKRIHGSIWTYNFLFYSFSRLTAEQNNIDTLERYSGWIMKKWNALRKNK